MSLSEAIAAATQFRQGFDPGDLIDPASGFSAMHLDLLVEWASTCSDAVATADDESTLREMDVTQLGDAGLAHFYFSELDIDPDLQGETGARLKLEIERRGLSDEHLAALMERTRQAHEAASAIETAEREAPPHFPEDVELPSRA
jgi:hypothetical protein